MANSMPIVSVFKRRDRLAHMITGLFGEDVENSNWKLLSNAYESVCSCFVNPERLREICTPILNGREGGASRVRHIATTLVGRSPWLSGQPAPLPEMQGIRILNVWPVYTSPGKVSTRIEARIYWGPDAGDTKLFWRWHSGFENMLAVALWRWRKHDEVISLLNLPGMVVGYIHSEGMPVYIDAYNSHRKYNWKLLEKRKQACLKDPAKRCTPACPLTVAECPLAYRTRELTKATCAVCREVRVMQYPGNTCYRCWAKTYKELIYV